MQLKLFFEHGNCIDIRLFDNKPVVKWFSHFSRLADYDYEYAKSYRELFRPLDQSAISTQWKIIQTSLQQLKELKYNIPFDLPATFKYDQNVLNQLHRFFTYNAMWYNEVDSDNPYDKNFVLDRNKISYERWFDIIDPINDAVHKLENCTLTDNKKFILNNHPLDLIYVILKQRNPSDFTPWLDFDQQEQNHNYSYFDYDSPSVLLDNSILGKSVLQCFYEHDDLNAKDCSGRLGSYGGFVIDLNCNRKKIYQSKEFLEWIATHNRTFDSLPLEFPIGYVYNYDEVLSWKLDNFVFKKIEFNDQAK